MSLVESLHQEHVARRARLYGRPVATERGSEQAAPVKPKPVIIVPEAPQHNWPELKGRLRLLLEDVARKHSLSPNDLRSTRRFKKLSAARQEYFYRALVETDHSLPQIGRVCGDRDHSTVIWGVTSYCGFRDIPLPRGMSVGPNKRARVAASKLRREAML